MEFPNTVARRIVAAARAAIAALATVTTVTTLAAVATVTVATVTALGVAGPATAADAKPDIFLLKTYDGQEVRGWVMSEKLDGVRGIWDGRRLISRGGKAFNAPAWFTRDFPPFALDGELWSARGEFETITSIVRRETPDDRWRRIHYHIFEVPEQAGGLPARLQVLRDYLRGRPATRIKIIPQTTVESAAHLQEFLSEVTTGGGEGVVVRDPTTPYQTGRLASALKVKNHQDAECEVREILPGKGKFTGMMGALRCEMAGGQAVNIGSGFTDAERANPPPPGSTITFKHYGWTGNGKPRFPVFLRRRN